MVRAMPIISNPGRKNDGFTLVEVLVAMLVLLVGMLGLLQTVGLATEHNLKNALRTEATQVAAAHMKQLKVKPFQNISAAYPVQKVASKLSGIKNRYHEVSAQSNLLTGGFSKELIVRVKWGYKNVFSTQELRSVISQRS